MIYNERLIEELYQRNLVDAHKLLASIQVADGRGPNVKGLSGWVYEQTIRYCLEQELKSRNIHPPIKEQIPISGRAKIDLLISRVAIEIKSRGAFSRYFKEKYKKYRAEVEKRGWVYFYITGRERYYNYRLMAENTFGKNRAFFLDTDGDWERFVMELIENLDD